MSEHVGLAIGTHTWAPNNDEEVGKIVDVMRKHQLTILDTARLYVCIEPLYLTPVKTAESSVAGPVRIDPGAARVSFGVYHLHESSHRRDCWIREEYPAVRQGEHGSSANYQSACAPSYRDSLPA